MSADLQSTDIGNDIASDVSSAWTEVEGQDSGVAAPPPEPQAPLDGYSRGPDGRFVARQPQEEAPAVPMEPPAAGAPTFMPPTSWSPVAKAEFARLSPQVQEAIAVREQEVAQGFEMYQGLRDWVEFAEENGQSLPQAIQEGYERLQNYHAAEDFLANDFYGAVSWLANHYGVNPQHLVERYIAEQQGQPYQAPPAPQPDPLIPYLQELQGQVQDLRNYHEQAQNEAINSQIEAFAQDHIYFPDVENAMADVINHIRLTQGREPTLEEAYETACWAHPEIRQILMQELQANPSNGQQAQPAKPSSNRGRSLQPGSPVPGASDGIKTKKGNNALQDVEEIWNALSGA